MCLQTRAHTQADAAGGARTVDPRCRRLRRCRRRRRCRGRRRLQDVQEEILKKTSEKSVLLGGDEEGLGSIIFGLDAVARVVLLEVEQAAWKTNEQVRCNQGTTLIDRAIALKG